MDAERIGAATVEEIAFVHVEYHGQLAYPCEILRSFGFMRRVVLPVKGGYYRLVWVPRWKVLDA